MHTAPATTYRTHMAVMQAAGPRALADLALEPTVDELADFEARMASLDGLGDGQIAARVGIPVGLVPKFRQLMTPVVTR